MKFSSRSSAHLTGRPVAIAAAATTHRLGRRRALAAEGAAHVGHDHADRLLRAIERQPPVPRAAGGVSCAETQTVSRSVRLGRTRRSRRAAPSARPRGAESRGRRARRAAADSKAPSTSPADPVHSLQLPRSRARVEHRLERLVVDLDQLGGVLGQRARLGQHRAPRAGRRSAPRRRRAPGARVGGDSTPSIPCTGRSRAWPSRSAAVISGPPSSSPGTLDAADARVGERAAHERHVQHAPGGSMSSR